MVTAPPANALVWVLSLEAIDIATAIGASQQLFVVFLRPTTICGVSTKGNI